MRFRQDLDLESERPGTRARRDEQRLDGPAVGERRCRPARAIQSEWPINGMIFRAEIEQLLLPMLQPGDIVIRDNLGSHASRAIRSAIRSAGQARAPAAISEAEYARRLRNAGCASAQS
jgi:hypothetical protein